MEVIGKIIQKLPMQSGVSKAGNNWSKQEYVLETQESYPKKIFFSFFGDRANQYPLEVGDNIKLSFDIDCHEYNGRWFTSINAWKSEKVDATAPTVGAVPEPPAGSTQSAPQPIQGQDFMNGAANTDDLPF